MEKGFLNIFCRKILVISRFHWKVQWQMSQNISCVFQYNPPPVNIWNSFRSPLYIYDYDFTNYKHFMVYTSINQYFDWLCEATNSQYYWFTIAFFWDIPGFFFVYFRPFDKQTLKILQQINVQKCPSSIRHWNSNRRPSEHESPPMTTRPGLTPIDFKFLFCYFCQKLGDPLK